MIPKVSIIVPVYNVEPYIERCVESLRNQTLKDIEIVLVDDESPDNCPAICDEYTGRDSRIKVVHKKNGGLGLACNTGIEAATGDYIAFCDSDDWVDTEMYETLYREAIGNNADMVFTGLKRVGSDGTLLSYLPHPSAKEFHQRDTMFDLAMDIIASEPHVRMDRRMQVSAKTVLYRRRMLLSNGLRFVSEREYPSEDLIFNVSVLLKANRICIIPYYFYNYFVNTNSITSTVKQNHFEKMMRSALLLKNIIADSLPNYNECSAKTLNRRVSRFIIGESRSFSRHILASSMPSAIKKEQLLKIISNECFRNAISDYPISEMPIAHRIAIKLLVNKHFWLLNRLYWLKH